MVRSTLVVMLSYDCWRNRFHADSSVVGEQIVLNHRPVTVIGVLPQSLGPYFEELEIFCTSGSGLLRKTRKRQSGQNESPDHRTLETGSHLGASAFRGRSHRRPV